MPGLDIAAIVIPNASNTSVKGAPAFSVYSAPKAAVRSFVRSWTVDLKECRIRTRATSPGPIELPGLKGLAENEEQEQQNKVSPIAVVSFAPDDFSFLTGIELFVEGGASQI